MRIKVLVTVPFNELRLGDESWVPVTPRIEALVSLGYLKIIDREETSGGTTPRSKRAAKNRSGDESRGAEGGRETSPEQGEDPDPSGHGPFEGVAEDDGVGG